MKLTIKIDSNKHPTEFNQLVNASNMAAFIWDFKQVLRGYAKHDSTKTPDEIYTEFCEALTDNGIDIDKLWG